MRNKVILEQEQFLFTIIDKINEKLERVMTKIMLNVKEFYFDDDLELCIMVRNITPSKYPLKAVKFKQLPHRIKKDIIRILKTKC